MEVSSLLTNLQGSNQLLEIKLENDRPKALFFFDIDKTLVHIEDIYKIIRPKLWPNVDTKNQSLDKIHLDGFQLGTMWHEMIRMKRINEGNTDFLNPQVTEMYFAEGGEGYGIEHSDHPLHMEADEELQRFDLVAVYTCNEAHRFRPEVFEQSKIKPISHLLERYKHLGIPMVGMSANPRRFIHAVCTYTGLSTYFLACGNDTDTLGMKEYKMLDLIEQLKDMGLPIPYDNLCIFGDSPNGDIGSGLRFEKLVKEKHPEVFVRGILVCDNAFAHAKGREKITDKVFRARVHAFNLELVQQDTSGRPLLWGRHRKKFLTLL